MEPINTAIQRKKILQLYGVTERFCSESERLKMTGVSRTQAFEMEKNGDFPLKIKLSKRRTVWFLSDLLIWMDSRAALQGVNYEQ